VQALAEAARTLTAPGDTILFAGGNYYSVAHQFVFYSDRLLRPGSTDPADVRAGLERGRWALVENDRYASVSAGGGSRYPKVLSAGGWAMVHRAPAPPVRLRPAPPAGADAPRLSLASRAAPPASAPAGPAHPWASRSRPGARAARRGARAPGRRRRSRACAPRRGGRPAPAPSLPGP